MPLIKTIAENPFRILGLPVTATDRDIKKQLNKLGTYYEMGKTVEHDTDFPVFSNIVRSPEIIAEAAARIELPEQKLFYANFWFWPHNAVDELVLEVLKDGNVDKAVDLWEKAALAQALTSKNYSNFKNLALLNLIKTTERQTVSLEQLELAVSRYEVLFGSASYADFCSAVTLGSYKGDILSSQKSFVDVLSAHLGLSKTNVDQRIAGAFVSGFANGDSPVGAYVKLRFTEAPTHRIDKALASVESRRRADPEDSYDACIELVNQVDNDIEFLQSVLPASDLHLQSVSDRIANELLRSSTAYYNSMYEDDETTETIKRSTRLTKIAERFAKSGTVKSEVSKDLELLNGFLKSHREQIYALEFASELSKLPSLDGPTLNEIRSIPPLLSVAITNCSAVLGKMANGVDAHDSTYMQASDMLAGYGLAQCIVYANKMSQYDDILPLMNRLNKLRMSVATRARFDENYKILRSNQAMANTRFDNNSAKVSQQDSGNCYIATMAFGSYEAPEVLELRRFRDECLAKSLSGRVFIRIYYALSPHLVSLLKDHKAINRRIRVVLRKFIEVIN